MVLQNTRLNVLLRVCDHTVRAALLNDCKSPFGVEGASKVFSLGVISKPLKSNL